MMHLSRTYTFAFALLFSFLTLPLSAQKPKKTVENTLTEADNIPLLRGLAVSYNVSGTIMRMVGDYGEFEAALRCNLRDRYFPIVEMGLGSAKHEVDPVTGITAKTNAPFFRLGCDYNIAKNKHDDYRVLVGARYGFTSFKQDITGVITDPYWGGAAPYSIDSNTNTYHWGELLFGVDAKLWGPVRLGWSFRYKMKLSGHDNDNEKLWYIPGFGKNGNVLGGIFYVSIQLQRPNKKVTASDTQENK